MEITIRKFRQEDAHGFHQAILESVAHVSPWLGWCTADYSLVQATEWATTAAQLWEQKAEYRFVIQDAQSQMILGSVGLNQIVHQHKVANLGYWVRKSAIGKGVCTNATRQVIQYAFEHLDLKRIEIHALPENQASNAVALKVGGVYEGRFRNKLINQGQSLAANCYSVVPSDYDV